jgi:hypothetical protein
MCNETNCSHDFDDQIADLFGAASATSSHALADGEAARALRSAYTEPCFACKGTGKFRSYSGRVVGDCFKCKGNGSLSFKTSPEQRAKSQASAAAARDRKAASIAEQAALWIEANPQEAEWLRDASAKGFDFAVSMLDSLNKYGSLTERQEVAVRNATAKWLERKAQWAAEKAAAPVLTLEKIRVGFDSALRFLKRPKLRIADIQFSLAPATGRNAGAIYVVRASDDTYLGKITPDDKFLRSRDCTDGDAEVVARVAADPAAAAEAHGHEYGQCSCCGRELTNPESVARGIGPICAERWGW